MLLYVSGGNTQVIARLEGKYRVLGETLDIGIGNMLDKFARAHGIPFPGGTVIEKLAAEWLNNNPNPTMDGLELPYAVRGMDLAFSGVLTAALRLVENGKPLEAVCWSLQEHVFSACVEVAERALAHTGKTELLLGGGVACNSRLRTMCELMCEERDSKGLYALARKGVIKEFTGISDPYEKPENPDIIIDSSKEDPEILIEQIINKIKSLGYMNG